MSHCVWTGPGELTLTVNPIDACRLEPSVFAVSLFTLLAWSAAVPAAGGPWVGRETRALFPCDPAIAAIVFAEDDAGWVWHVVPDGLMYRSYLAGPKEPRFANRLLYDVRRDRWTMEPTLGGRVGFLRFGTTESDRPIGWQLDFEGAVMPRLDAAGAMDVESVDYRFGLLSTQSSGATSLKLGYFHLSSHAGDEFLIKNPGFQRINYVRESLIVGVSHDPGDHWRLYGEAAWAFIVRGGARPWEFQFGTEYCPSGSSSGIGAPFAAANFSVRQEVDFEPGVSITSGWQWQGPRSGRSLRFGVEYFEGPSNQYQFFQQRERQIGVGLWFDY